MTRELVLVIGMQGSGKTTVAKDLCENHGYIRICRDEEGGSMDDLLPYVINALKMNMSIVMDNTFMTSAYRKPFIGLAMAAGVPVRCIEMTTSLEDCQFNAVQRMIDITGKLLGPAEIKALGHTNIFPPVVQFGFRKNYEPPNMLEGFTSIEQRPFVRKLNPKFKNKAILLDYDGTLRTTINGNDKYPTELEQIQAKPNVKKVLDAYKKKKYHLLGVSNQSPIHKGEFTAEKATELFNHTNKLVGHDIDFAFCPHQSAPPVCYCRKPAVGFGVHFINKYKLNPADCIFVGDMTTDKTFATRCGFQYVDQAEFFKETS